MKRFILNVLGAIALFASMGYAFEFNIDPTQTGMIQISTNSATPTQIFNNDPSAMRTYIVNTSTNAIWIVGFSTTTAISISSASVVNVSTTSASGSFFLPAEANSSNFTNQPIYFSPDGPIDPYRGPMWAVSAGQGGAFIERFRAH